MDRSSTKNSYELLSMSDSDSYSPQPVPEITIKSPIRRKRLKKRLPSRKVPNESVNGCCRSDGKIFSFSCVFVIFFCWLIILTWMVIVFNAELRRFDNNIMKIVAGNQGHSDVLQKCDSLWKDLQQNHTYLYSRLTNLTAKLDTFNSQLLEMKEKLKPLSSSKYAAGDDIIAYNLTTFSSQLAEFNVTLTGFLDTTFEILKKNFTDIETRLKIVELASNISASFKDNITVTKLYGDLVSLVANATVNFASMNETLSSQFQNITNIRNDDFILFQNLQNENRNTNVRISALEEKLYSNGVFEKIRELVNNKTKDEANWLFDKSTIVNDTKKEAIPEVINNNCRSCSPGEANDARKIVSFVKQRHPDVYEQVVDRYTK